MFKKKAGQKVNFAPKIALRVELSDPARNHQFRADFLSARFRCSRYFLMTFRKRIRKNKFSKNGFHNLQGTMSHRPLTNTSSLKITAAYCAVCTVSIELQYTHSTV